MRMRRRALLRLMLGAAGLGNSGCGRETFVYRYRLTLEIETPEGVKIGSGVLECRAFDDTNAKIYFAERRAGSRVRGEAVTIDLGHRGVLFALLARAASATSSEAADLPEAAARRAGLVVDGRTQTPKRYDLFTDLLREVSALRGKIPVRPAELPMLVRFRDTGDPRSVEAVDPKRSRKELRARREAVARDGRNNQRSCDDGDREEAGVDTTIARKHRNNDGRRCFIHPYLQSTQ